MKTLKRNWQAAVFSLLLLSLLPVFALAQVVVRGGETVSITDGQVVEGDLYVVAGTFSHSGTVDGDELVLAGRYVSNGVVNGDLLVVGGSVQHHASVTDDVRVVGGDVVISEAVGGDVFVIGGVLEVLSTATIEGDLVFFGGELIVDGSVGGTVMGTSDSVRVNGTASAVDVSTRQLTLGEQADVAGDVRYISAEELSRSQSAVVGGEVVRNDPVPVSNDFSDFSFTTLILQLLMTIFASLVIYLLLRDHLLRQVEGIIGKVGVSTAVGFGFVILAPVTIIILLATVLGSMVGLTLLFGTLFLYVYAALVAPVLLGALLSHAVTKEVKVDWVWIVVGAVVAHALLLIPLIGAVFVLYLFILTVGGLLFQLYRAIT